MGPLCLQKHDDNIGTEFVKKIIFIFQENVCYDATLAFSLICKVKQISNNQEYYRSENDVQEAPVSYYLPHHVQSVFRLKKMN